MRRPDAWLAMVAAFILFAGCSDTDDELAQVRRALDSIVATCSARSGDVQVKRADEGFWNDVEVASVFRAGDWVKTGTFSSARIELLGGGALELDEGATIVLEADPVGRQGGAAPRVAVQEGAVRGRISAAENALGLKVKMADGTTAELSATSPDPAEFRLTGGAEGTEVAVERGSVTLATARGSTELSEGTAAALGHGLVRRFDLLQAPELLAPLYEARLQFVPGAPVSLAWKALPGAGKYRLEVAREPSFEDPVDASVLDGTAYDFQPAAAGSYLWRVAAEDGSGRVGRFSEPRRLFVESADPTDHLQRPDDGVVYQFVDTAPKLTFSWTGSDATLEYLLVIATGPDLLHQRMRVEKVSGTTAVIEGLESGRHFWGVYSVDPERPLFVAPRTLELRKTNRAVLRAPRRINRWGN